MTRRAPLTLLIALVAGVAASANACGSHTSGDENGPPNGADGGGQDDGGGLIGSGSDGSMVGKRCFDPADLSCQQDNCAGGGKTTLSGTVYDPAGKVPLYDVGVYVPRGALRPITDGVSCDRCSASKDILVSTLTDTAGHFVLEDVPSGVDLPLVLEVGKWRRVVKLPAVQSCVDTPVNDPQLLRLPKNRSEGNIPRIAVSTGAADPFECFLPKIGIDLAEFGTAGSDARIHLYAGYGYTDPSGGPPKVATSSFAPSLNNGAAFADAETFYSDAAKLAAYDILILACEGYYNPDKKPNRQALVDFTTAGGRVFASHWHRYFFHDDTSPSPFPPVATWVDRIPPVNPLTNPIDGDVDTSFPKGLAMRDWLVTAKASTTPGKLTIREAKHNVDAVDKTRAQQWITLANPLAGNATAVEYMSFNTPVGIAADQQCGRVVYSSLHVSSGDAMGVPFPTGCKSTDLSPQEKALEFMLFDLSACIQPDNVPPAPPR